MRQGLDPVGSNGEAKPGLGHAEQMPFALTIAPGQFDILCRAASILVAGDAIRLSEIRIVFGTPTLGL
jgi:hypothetical protein